MHACAMCLSKRQYPRPSLLFTELLVVSLLVCNEQYWGLNANRCPRAPPQEAPLIQGYHRKDAQTSNNVSNMYALEKLAASKGGSPIQKSHVRHKANISAPMTRNTLRRIKYRGYHTHMNQINLHKQPSPTRSSVRQILYSRRRYHRPSRGVARHFFEIVQSAEAHCAQAIEVAIAIHL